MAQEQIKKIRGQEKGGGSPPANSAEVTEKGKQTAKDAKDIIDKIDDILEKNAEQFVKDYVQKGGE